MKPRRQSAKSYIRDVLDRPGMYAGPHVQTLELVLLNLLNLWAVTFAVDCDPREVLRKTFFDVFQTSAGAGGPSSRFIDNSSIYSHDQILDFYRTFTENVLKHQSEDSDEA